MTSNKESRSSFLYVETYPVHIYPSPFVPYLTQRRESIKWFAPADFRSWTLSHGLAVSRPQANRKERLRWVGIAERGRFHPQGLNNPLSDRSPTTQASPIVGIFPPNAACALLREKHPTRPLSPRVFAESARHASSAPSPSENVTRRTPPVRAAAGKALSAATPHDATPSSRLGSLNQCLRASTIYQREEKA